MWACQIQPLTSVAVLVQVPLLVPVLLQSLVLVLAWLQAQIAVVPQAVLRNQQQVSGSMAVLWTATQAAQRQAC